MITFDLWLFDEFQELEDTGTFGAMDEGSPFYNTLLRMLDEQECRNDSKYSRVHI